jgi:hypothetical protein
VFLSCCFVVSFIGGVSLFMMRINASEELIADNYLLSAISSSEVEKLAVKNLIMKFVTLPIYQKILFEYLASKNRTIRLKTTRAFYAFCAAAKSNNRFCRNNARRFFDARHICYGHHLFHV